MARFLLLLSSLCFTALPVSGQDTARHPVVKVLPVPAFGYSPETNTYLGIVALFTLKPYKDSATRPSNARLEVNYTWNKQLIVEAGWNYFFRKEAWLTQGRLQCSKYPDLYYGIGPETQEACKLTFNSNRLLADVAVLKKIGDRLLAGIRLRYIDYSKVSDSDSMLRYPELTDGTTMGIGYTLLKDSRNNLLTPSAGLYAYGNVAYYFAHSDYLKLTMDLRYYKTWNSCYTLAARFINELNTGTPPFYDYAFIGGDQYVRGYYYGRFRDNGLSAIQTECRFPVYRRFGVAAFGGVSTVYSEFKNVSTSGIKYNAGLGIRFLIDRKEKINLRLDYAIGQHESNGFYIAFGESF